MPISLSLNQIDKKVSASHQRFRIGLPLLCLAFGFIFSASAQTGYSSSVQTPDAPAPTLTASAEAQPSLYAAKSLSSSAQNGPYSRPSYAPSEDFDFHKYSFAAGGGFNVPAGDTAKYQTTGWNILIAGGRNLNKILGGQVQYNYDHFGIPANQLNLVGEPNGDVHIWSFSADPYVNLPSRGKAGAYAIGGVGFYRKVTEFTEPYTSCYYYCYSSNVVVAHFSNNAFGANLGLGLTWKLSRWNNAKFFSEARYVWLNNQQTTNSQSDGYTPANDRTGYFPVTFGLRF